MRSTLHIPVPLTTSVDVRPRRRTWRRRPWRPVAVSLLLQLLVLPGTSRADRGEAFFEERVRPLLIEHCLDCHGPVKQESGLRLDSRQGWEQGGDRGSAIVPGDPAASLLIAAIEHADAKLQMPHGQKQLTPREIADLVEWVRRGAPDPRRPPAAEASPRMSLEDARDFWAFQLPDRPPVPSNHDHAWKNSPLDAFLLAELERRGLSPVGDADRRTLIRRATFDLTGLPPTPSDVAAFVADESPRAFAAVVDRLLASPAYGERWGRHWLDIARYADTAGDGADYPIREAASYRDWVIEAFNSDQPFDEFIREQIAGDILARQGPPERYASRVTATGFLAIGKRYGYQPSPKYQHLDFADAIDSVGRSLLGLSLGCARCHDHKYDPISTADYYALYGIFQSSTWAFPGGEEHKRPAHLVPLVPPDEAARLDEARAQKLARLDRQISLLRIERAQLDPAWWAGGVDLAFESQAAGGPPDKPWVYGGPVEIRADAQSPFQHVHPAGEVGVRLSPGEPGDGIRYVFEHGLRATSDPKIHFTIDFRTGADSMEVGAYRFYLGRGVVESQAIECSVTAREFAIRNGSDWEVIRRLTPGTWYTLRLTIDSIDRTAAGVVGSVGDLVEFENLRLNPDWDGVVDTFICDAKGHVEGRASPRDLDNIGLLERAFAAPGSGAVTRREPVPDAKERMAELDEKMALLKRRRALAARTPYEVAYGVREGTPVDARIQERGDPQRPGRIVRRRFLEALGGDPLPEGMGSGRLALANWLTRPSNPLTARVFVNRVWQWHFGRGLVATPSDFGVRGERPSHPELLNWLTAEFVASGWSVKSLHRLIMRSRVYQLASDDDAANLQVDPDNRWLWRHSRRPLDAEALRDAMLTISDELDRSTPEPHPFPPVDTWGFTIHHPFHAVYDSNHRSVYLMVQRNRRHPFLALFDAADPNFSVATRQPTTTPNQALYLMNSPFVHDRSRAFARQLLAASGDNAARLRLAFEAACGRVPEDAVFGDALAFVDAYRTKLAGQEPAGGDRELEAWAAVVRVILTSNAFLYVD